MATTSEAKQQAIIMTVFILKVLCWDAVGLTSGQVYISLTKSSFFKIKQKTKKGTKPGVLSHGYTLYSHIYVLCNIFIVVPFVLFQLLCYQN